jgi:hypothetical protein
MDAWASRRIMSQIKWDFIHFSEVPDSFHTPIHMSYDKLHGTNNITLVVVPFPSLHDISNYLTSNSLTRAANFLTVLSAFILRNVLLS